MIMIYLIHIIMKEIRLDWCQKPIRFDRYMDCASYAEISIKTNVLKTSNSVNSHLLNQER